MNLNGSKKKASRSLSSVTKVSLFSLDVEQEMNNSSSAAEYYKEVLKQDNTHVEAIACIGSNHFYSDQPEVALRFYRWVLHCMHRKRWG
jgi:hypothetical protein